MGYDKTVWVNEDEPAIDADNLNHIENWNELVAKGTYIYATSTTGNDTYVFTFTTPYTAYNTGLIVRISVDTANTGAATGNIDTLGAKDIKKIVAAGKVALDTGDMIPNVPYDLFYDGTDFVILNPTSILDDIIKGTAYQGVRMKSDETGVEFGNVMIGASQVYTSGTNDFTAPKTGIYKVTVIGGGGSGGRSAIYNSGGGGGGGTAIKFVSLTKDDAVTYVVGAGGAYPGSDGTGGNGGTSSFGAHCSATGGNGGNYVTSAISAAGGTGGYGTSGNINMYGSNGREGYTQNPAAMVAGIGGTSYFGQQIGAGDTGNSTNGGYAGMILIEW